LETNQSTASGSERKSSKRIAYETNRSRRRSNCRGSLINDGKRSLINDGKRSLINDGKRSLINDGKRSLINDGKKFLRQRQLGRIDRRSYHKELVKD
jgi:hypothetical protein